MVIMAILCKQSGIAERVSKKNHPFVSTKNVSTKNVSFSRARVYSTETKK